MSGTKRQVDRKFGATRALAKPGTHPVTAEQVALHQQGYQIGIQVHLEMEAWYLFAKIVLDDVARAIEYYFGPAQRLAIDSHADLCARIAITRTHAGEMLIDRCRLTVRTDGHDEIFSRAAMGIACRGSAGDRDRADRASRAAMTRLAANPNGANASAGHEVPRYNLHSPPTLRPQTRPA